MQSQIARLIGAIMIVALSLGARGLAEAAGPASKIDKAALVAESRVLQLLNSDRAAHGLGPLSLSTRLGAVARAHSRDMARRHYFAHVTPEGRDPFARMAAAGITYQSAGENLGEATGYAPLQAVQVLNDQMMAEPPHQENHRAIILNGGLHQVGIGVVVTASGSTYLTEDFTN